MTKKCLQPGTWWASEYPNREMCHFLIREDEVQGGGEQSASGRKVGHEKLMSTRLYKSSRGKRKVTKKKKKKKNTLKKGGLSKLLGRVDGKALKPCSWLRGEDSSFLQNESARKCNKRKWEPRKRGLVQMDACCGNDNDPE